ncbi:hypothetical protein Tco_0625476 [Tanacetum coccineum]|uniref:Uncharacterized protein n=1 Tax=Tanacetum coccineum TaxID=301880 RepID=A0ABQ4WGW9_9ASTR
MLDLDISLGSLAHFLIQSQKNAQSLKCKLFILEKGAVLFEVTVELLDFLTADFMQSIVLLDHVTDSYCSSVQYLSLLYESMQVCRTQRYSLLELVSHSDDLLLQLQYVLPIDNPFIHCQQKPI